MSARVLVVEDEAEMRMILRDNLEDEGWEVLLASSGEDAVRLALTEVPNLVLLDVMLPRMSGYEVCRRIRSGGFDAPIIMLTARNTELDRVTGLELGADDYIGKPFSMRELLARVRAHLRRSEHPARNPDRLEVNDLVIDVRRREIERSGQPLDVSAREFDLLLYLASHPREVVSRERLLKEVWGYDHLPLTRTVDNFVAKLRRKLEVDPSRPRYIITVHGAGYRLRVD